MNAFEGNGAECANTTMKLIDNQSNYSIHSVKPINNDMYCSPVLVFPSLLLSLSLAWSHSSVQRFASPLYISYRKLTPRLIQFGHSLLETLLVRSVWNNVMPMPFLLRQTLFDWLIGPFYWRRWSWGLQAALFLRFGSSRHLSFKKTHDQWWNTWVRCLMRPCSTFQWWYGNVLAQQYPKFAIWLSSRPSTTFVPWSQLQ